MNYEGFRKLAGLSDDRVLEEADLPSVSKYEENPEAYNAQLAKLMQQLKRDKSTGVTGIRQGYKGTGKQAHKRQIWAKMPEHERGGPDIWLETGFVKVGGIIDIPKVIPSVKKYEGESPEAVYRWIADTMKALKKWTDDKYAQSPAVKKEENEMDIVAKLEALRLELESKISDPEPGPAEYEKPPKPAELKQNEKPVGKAMPWPTKGAQSKPKPVSVPEKRGATVGEKLEALRLELEALGEAHTPTAYRVGTVRTWKSGKFKKTATGWVPVTALLKKVAGAPKGATAHQDLKHAAFGKVTHDVKSFINTPGVVTYVPPGTGRKSPEATKHATPSGGSTPGYSHQSKSSGHGAGATPTPSQSAAPSSTPGGVLKKGPKVGGEQFAPGYTKHAAEYEKATRGKAPERPHFGGTAEHRYEDGKCVYCGKSKPKNEAFTPDVIPEFSSMFRRLTRLADERVLPEESVANMSDADVVKTAHKLAKKAHTGKLSTTETKNFKMAMQRIKDEGLLSDDDVKDIWKWHGGGGQ